MTKLITEPLVRRAIGEMLSIPGGRFDMGCAAGDDGCASDEEPAHPVQVRPFRLGKYAVTFSQWDAFAEAANGYRPDDRGWGRGNLPVINVSWDDIQIFLGWLNANSDGRYRLPSEAEWEYAARAGTVTRYSWGDSIGQGRANCDICGSGREREGTTPVGSYLANGFGLFDMHGNVYEWTQDCWNESYMGAPGDGSAWMSGDCSSRVVRGGAWLSEPVALRSSHRNWVDGGFRVHSVGFRLAQDGF